MISSPAGVASVKPRLRGYCTDFSALPRPLNFSMSLAGCGDSTHRCAVGGTGDKPKAERALYDTGEIKINGFPVTLTRQRVVESPTPAK